MDVRKLSALLSDGSAPAVEVHAIDPSIYLVYCRIDEQLTPLLDARGHRLKYRSRSAAMQYLRKTGVRTVDFVHRSAFEEMIGINHNARPTEHRETLTLAASTHLYDL